MVEAMAESRPAERPSTAVLGWRALSPWAAVKGGDSGSAEDIGRIPRGVLERTTEAVVFSLDKDGVREPLETPRGYWVVKRFE